MDSQRLTLDCETLRSNVGATLERAEWHTEVSSTNSVAAHRLAAPTHGRWSLVGAARQLEGRGRRGHTWHSDGHACLMFSLATHLDLPAAVWPRASLIVGWAIVEALGLSQLKIKWPNDVLLWSESAAPRKLAGVLCERHEVIDRRGPPLWVVGVGLNLSRPRAPDEVASTAAGLDELMTVREDVTSLLSDLVTSIIGQVHAWQANDAKLPVRALTDVLAYRDRAVAVELQRGRVVRRWLHGLAEDGKLLLSELGPDSLPRGPVQQVDPWRLLGAG